MLLTVHNLPFLHACSVLNEVLSIVANEGAFSCKSFFLGALVKASKTHINWISIVEVDSLVTKRNDLAHHGLILPRGECWQHIDVIEKELKGWTIIT
jgi:hypothetical protein